MISILDFSSYSVFIATTQLCLFNVKAAIDDTQMNWHGCVPVTLNLQKQVGGHSLVTPGGWKTH